MNRPHFRRHPRPTDPDPYTQLDHLDGLPGRVHECPLCVENRGLPGRTRYDAEWPDVLAAEGADRLSDAQVLFAEQVARLAAATGISEADVAGDLADLAAHADEWSSLPPVYAPHSFVGGDLAAMAAPGDWPVFTGWGEYDIEREPVAVTIRADVSRFHGAMAQAQAATTAAAKPHGRHRQTDPADLLLADLRDIEDRLS